MEDEILIENNDLKNQMAVERYKFILEKIKFLDTTYNTNFNHVSKIITAVIGFMITVLMVGIEKKFGINTVTIAMELSTLLVGGTAFFFSLLSISSLFSWFDYRKEEVKLHQQLNINIGREEPEWKGLIRWHETHLITLLLLCSTFSFYLYYNTDTIVKLLGFTV